MTASPCWLAYSRPLSSAAHLLAEYGCVRFSGQAVVTGRYWAAGWPYTYDELTTRMRGPCLLARMASSRFRVACAFCCQASWGLARHALGSASPARWKTVSYSAAS